MNIVYIISAYKFPTQLARLVYKLNTANSVFFIHVDKKTSPRIFAEIKQLLNKLDNVYFLDRHQCYWGDFGHVAASLKGIREIYRKKINFDYVILLTGQCYPIQSNQAIDSFFTKSNDQSFIEYFPVEEHRKKRIERWNFHIFSSLFFSFPNTYIPIPVKRLNSKAFAPYFRGSSYWCLHKQCIEYILDFLSKDSMTNNGKFINFFKGVYIPDEFFFQTILLNSPLQKSIVNDNLRYIKWPAGVYEPHPLVLNQSYFDEIMSSKKLFARKFDMSIDSKILDRIDEITQCT